MAFRIKFRITESTEYFFSPTTRRLVLTSVPDDSVPENDRFSSNTLGGAASFAVTCDNPRALAALARIRAER